MISMWMIALRRMEVERARVTDELRLCLEKGALL